MKQFLLLAAVFFSLNAQASETIAKEASGMDKINRSTVNDCSYVINLDDSDPSLLVIGLQSASAPYNNAILHIPASDLPLPENFQMTDIRGTVIHYSNGVLKATREKNSEGAADEQLDMELHVSPNLQSISSGQIEKTEGHFIQSDIAKMNCGF